jgi:hypothetical protein
MVLINDWPYGLEAGILHLVVWTKAQIPTKPDDGDLTPESQKNIADYVSKTFTKFLGEENVLWFKNWASIQSVRSVEHIHILIRNYTTDFLERVVGKDAHSDTNQPIGEMEREKLIAN